MSAEPRPRRGRQTRPTGEVRNQKITSYVTLDERIAHDKLATDYSYESGADAIRRGLALLIATRHPELLPYLREDLKQP